MSLIVNGVSHVCLPKGKCSFGCYCCCCCAQFSPHFTAIEKREDSAERLVLPREGAERHPSDFFPSFLTRTTKSQSKCRWKSEDGPEFWEQSSALGSRPELPNPTATTRRCSEFNQNHQALSRVTLTSAQWKMLENTRTTDNALEHFTLDHGTCWVNTLPSCKPGNHSVKQGQIHQPRSENSEFSKTLKTKRYFPKFGASVFGAKT